MKFKKIVLGIAASLLLFSLAGCNSDPRKEFADALYPADTTEFNAAKFDMSIKELTFNEDKGDASVRMIANQLKDMSIDGTYAVDEKAKAMEMEVNLNLLGEKIPLQLVGGNETFYLSTSFISGVTNLAAAFGMPSELSQGDLKKLEGKYLDFAETSKNLSPNQANEANALFKKAFSGDKTNSKANSTELKKFAESFDKKTFKKEKDIITHTFTKEEFIKIIEFANQNLDSEEQSKDAELNKQAAETLQSLKKDIDKLELKVSINTKNRKTDGELTIGMKQPTDISLVVAFSMTPQKNKTAIKLPAKNEILTQEELSKIMNEISAGTAATTTPPEKETALDYTDDPEVQALLNAQLDQMIAELNKDSISLDQETADEIRKSGQEVFNAEQMKKLNEALDKAVLK